jgi:hypothetical protein
VPLAGVLKITYAGVEIRRVNTDEWLPLPAGVVMPIGTGDSLRTNEQGRAWIAIGDTTAWATLPNTTWTLRDLSNNAAAVAVQLTLDAGEVAFQGSSATLTVETAHVTAASTAAGRLHVLAAAYPQRSVLVVDSGMLSAVAGDDRLTLTANTSVLADEALTLLATPQRPFSPARVVGEIDGCSSAITTVGGVALNARAGPSLDNVIYGVFPDGAPVQVMGVVSAGGWYRVQYGSGFGWVERLAVADLPALCDLPVLPDDSFDIPVRVINPDERELNLTQPFYGTPDDDRIFYRFMSDAE